MVTMLKGFNMKVYPPNEQGRGGFDEGRITEIKAVGFPGDGSRVHRVGPLFYFAWATGREGGALEGRPHKGFEIIYYVTDGAIIHEDSQGGRAQVETGGAQLLQAGSGIEHSERVCGECAQFFQIWLEPDFQEAISRLPQYTSYAPEQFPTSQTPDGVVRHLAGGDGPMKTTTDCIAEDIEIHPGHTFSKLIRGGRSLAAVVIAGKGFVRDEQVGKQLPCERRDFLVVDSWTPGTISFRGTSESPFRLLMLEMPTKVEYPLFYKH